MRDRLSSRVDAALRSRVLGLLACALSFALVMLRIDAKSMWWDESLSLMRAQSDVATILSGHIRFGGLDTVDQHPPLYFLALSAVTTLAGESDLSLRLLSALATVGVVAVTFALGRRLFGGRVAGMSAVFVALSPLLVWYGQEIRMYALGTLLCSLTLYAAWRATTEGSWPWAAGAVIALAAAAATQYLTLLFTLCAVVIAGFAHHWRARRAHHPLIATRVSDPWRSGAMAVFIFLVALSVAYALLQRLPPSGVYADPPLSLGSMLVDLLNSYSLGLSVSLRDVWWIDAVFSLVWLAGIGALLWPMLRRLPSGSSVSRTARVALLVAAPLVPVIVVWLLTRRVAFYRNSRYVMFAAPLFSLGLAWALTRRRWAPARWLLALGLLVTMGWSLQRYYVDPHYATKEEYAGAVDYVTARELSGDLLIVHGPESQAAVEHYYRGRLRLVSLPQAGTLNQLDEVLSETISGYDRVWVIHGRCNFTDPDEQLTAWFEEHTYREMTTTFSSYAALVSVSLYDVADPFRRSATPGESLATAGPARLVQASGLTAQQPQGPLNTLGEEATALTVASGESLAARLTWVLDAPTPDLKL
ncbi:MAG: glycosyltransferase family 39 protein, partial [Anaerolineales bacterium]